MIGRVARHIASLHPGLYALGFVFVGMAPVAIGYAGHDVPAWLPGAYVVVLSALMCGWWWSINWISRKERSLLGSSGDALLYAGPSFVGLISHLAGWSMNNSAAALAFFGLMFAAIWTTARAMTRAEGRDDAGTTISTCILLYLAPLGAWLLRRRIQGILATA